MNHSNLKPSNVHYSSHVLVCCVCKKRYTAHVRVGPRQKTCGRQLCKKAHRAHYQARWRRKNAEAENDIRQKRIQVHGKDYWKNWRAGHSEYVDKNRKASRKRMRALRKCLQRKRDIRQVLDSIE